MELRWLIKNDTKTLQFRIMRRVPGERTDDLGHTYNIWDELWDEWEDVPEVIDKDHKS